MRTFCIPAIGAAAILVMIFTVVSPAAAQAPKQVSHGCTAAQIQSPKAAQCIRQMEQDVIAGSSILHAVYCSSSGAILCCQYDGNRILPASCSVQGGVSRPDSGIVGPLNGAVAPEPTPANPATVTTPPGMTLYLPQAP